MDLKLYLCLLVLEKESYYNLPKYSIVFLENYNSDYLCVIATLPENDYFDIKTNFEIFLDSINLSIPSEEEARLYLLKTYIENILNNSISIIEGFSLIMTVVYYNEDWKKLSSEMVYDYINFNSLYGLFVLYEEIYERYYRIPSKVSIMEEELEDIKIEIFVECQMFLSTFSDLEKKIFKK